MRRELETTGMKRLVFLTTAEELCRQEHMLQPAVGDPASAGGLD